MTTTDFHPPLVAILRGLEPERAADVARVLFDSGFRIVEVPLNRPGAIEGIAAIARMAPADALVGGGTMLAPADVDAVHAAGGRMMVSPNCNPAVIAQARQRGMFAALEAGASVLKLFPAEMIGPAGLKAMASVLPAGTGLWPVGGITPESLAPWVRAGATGFGIGSQLFKPGMARAEIDRVAREFVAAWAATR
jgi:2-dehydro-3-deoxyphosphogalactonate aldolase